MSKRWTMEEDLFVHAYIGIGDFIGPHDLGRPKGAATKRAKFLKESGAWDALDRLKQAEIDYRRATGRPVLEDGI